MKVRFPLLPAWLRWVTVAGITVFIFHVSIVTVPPDTPVDTVRPIPELLPLDKWRHILAYTAQGGSLAYALEGRNWRTRRLAVFVLIATVCFGLGIEFGQAFLPRRYFSLVDAYANAIGGVLSLSWYGVRRHLELVPLSTMHTRTEVEAG